MHDASCGCHKRIDRAIEQALDGVIGRMDSEESPFSTPGVSKVRSVLRPGWSGIGKLSLFTGEFADELDLNERSLLICQRWAEQISHDLLLQLDTIRRLVDPADKPAEFLDELKGLLDGFVKDISRELNVSRHQAFELPAGGPERAVVCKKRLENAANVADQFRQKLRELHPASDTEIHIAEDRAEASATVKAIRDNPGGGNLP